MQTDLFDEKGTFKSLQRDAQEIAKQFDAIVKLKPSDPEALDQLYKALAKLPSSEQLTLAVDELRSRGDSFLKSARASRADSFKRHEADFVRTMKGKEGTSIRESGNNAWRVGPLELEVDRESSRARVLYNREVVAPWKPVSSEEDIQKLRDGALKQLEASAIPDDTLPDLMWEAYEHLTRNGKRQHTGSVRVPLGELFRELRVALTRHELRGKPDRKLSRIDLPRWAFLYNLDRYRRLLSDLPPERRLSFETGSQHDHQRGLAMVVNGLDASRDYKSFCFVYAAHNGEQ